MVCAHTVIRTRKIDDLFPIERHYNKTLLAIDCVAIGLCGLTQTAQAGFNSKWVQLVPDGDTTNACASVRVIIDRRDKCLKLHIDSFTGTERASSLLYANHEFESRLSRALTP